MRRPRRPQPFSPLWRESTQGPALAGERHEAAVPHPLSALRGEFVWEGKYDAQGKRREPELPAVVPVPEPRETWQPPGDPIEAPNLLLEGDNLFALAALLATHRGQVQLIYIDPPFDTGADQTMRMPVGVGTSHRECSTSRGPAGHVQLVAYRDAWGTGAGSYLQRMYERLCLMRELLRPSGVLCLHCDWRSSAALRLVLDEVFGPERFVNEIVWHYYNKYSAAARRLPRAHDTILVYAQGPRPAINALRLPREVPSRQLVRESVHGVLRNARDARGRLRYRMVHDRKGDDVWRIPQLQPASREWSGYSTQKHHDLLARIVALASREGDLVADFFCGAGTTLAVAERMGRRWIGCDQGAMALHITRKRLLAARAADSQRQAALPAPPLVVASLASAARRDWYMREFDGDAEACRRHLLDALGAESTPATRADHRSFAPRGVHGWLDEAACAVSELDGPCTARQALHAVRAARAAGAKRLLLLAWAYAPQSWPIVQHEALASEIELMPLVVPEALATPAGSAPPTFRALPQVEARAIPEEIDPARLVVMLESYRPGAARVAWSGHWEPTPEPDAEPLQWLDGWSVDPASRPAGPFHHGWWDFRTPHKRALATRSEPLPAGPGTPCVLTTDVWGLATLHLVAPSGGQASQHPQNRRRGGKLKRT